MTATLQIRQENDHKHRFFWVCLLILLSLIFIRYSLQINYPRELLLPIAFLMALHGDRDEIIALCMCCIPLHSSLQYAYVVLFCIVAFILKYGNTIKLNISFIPIIMIVLWELLHCFNQFFSPVKLVHVLLPFALYLILMSSKTVTYDYAFIVRSMASTLFGSGLVLLGKLMFVSNFNVGLALSKLKRLGIDSVEMQVEGAEINPNTLGILCVLSITGLLQIRLNKERKKEDIWLIMILLVLGMLTSSRTYLACLLIMAICLLLGHSSGVKEKVKFLVLLISIVIVAVIVMMIVFPDILPYYIKRFQTEDITTGRNDLMLFYHSFIMSDLKVLGFGIGLTNFTFKLLESFIVPHVPHNGIQEMIIAWGVPGSILFCLVLLCMIWRSRKEVTKQILLNYIPLIIILAKVQVGQMLTSAYTMLAFGYAYLSLCYDFSVKKENQN